jgi:hypothetical protein
MWTCSRCRKAKSDEEFGLNRDPITVEIRPVNYACKACQRDYRQYRKLLKELGVWDKRERPKGKRIAAKAAWYSSGSQPTPLSFWEV